MAAVRKLLLWINDAFTTTMEQISSANIKITDSNENLRQNSNFIIIY